VQTHRCHAPTEDPPRDVARCESPVCLEEDLAILDEILADGACWAIALGERDELSLQVSPTDLATFHRPEVDRLGSVGDQDAFDATEQRSQLIRGAVSEDRKDRHRRRGNCPQLKRSACLPPPGAVGMLDGRLVSGAFCLLVPWLEQ